MTRAELEPQIVAAAHGACVDHIKVAGLRKPVCVLRGQDPDALVAEAKALAGLS